MNKFVFIINFQFCVFKNLFLCFKQDFDKQEASLVVLKPRAASLHHTKVKNQSNLTPVLRWL